MTKIILDTSIIRRYPQILSLNIPDTQLIMTQGVMWELNIGHSVFNVNLNNIISERIKKGRLLIKNTLDRDFSINERITSGESLSPTDLGIIALAKRLHLDNAHDKVLIATNDQAIIKYAQISGIGIISSINIKNTIDQHLEAKHVAKDVFKQIGKKKRWANINLLSLLIATTSLVLTLLKNYRNIFLYIYSSLKPYAFVPMVIVVAILLFYWREKEKISYGFAEFVFGLGTIGNMVLADDFTLDSAIHNTEFLIKVVGSLYLMVRGLDNFVKGMVKTDYAEFFTNTLSVGK